MSARYDGIHDEGEDSLELGTRRGREELSLYGSPARDTDRFCQRTCATPDLSYIFRNRHCRQPTLQLAAQFENTFQSVMATSPPDFE